MQVNTSNEDVQIVGTTSVTTVFISSDLEELVT